MNDSRISCIYEKDLQQQFAGKESAYMLFYRRKNLVFSKDDPSKTPLQLKFVLLLIDFFLVVQFVKFYIILQFSQSLLT